MKRDPLHRIVTKFRKGILGNRSSYDQCFAICAPLHGLLRFSGYKVNLIEGEVDYAENFYAHHYWLELSDGRIIDPTADQFKAPDGSAMPKVYIGEMPKWYRVLEAK